LIALVSANLFEYEAQALKLSRTFHGLAALLRGKLVSPPEEAALPLRLQSLYLIVPIIEMQSAWQNKAN
jgi:hypothetical protein